MKSFWQCCSTLGLRTLFTIEVMILKGMSKILKHWKCIVSIAFLKIRRADQTVSMPVSGSAGSGFDTR